LVQLLQVLQEKGFQLHGEGDSNWQLSAKDKPYSGDVNYNMWTAMLAFVCRAAPAHLFQYGYSPAQWLRSKQISMDNSSSFTPSLIVSNKDLLLQIPTNQSFTKTHYEALLMIAPRKVKVESRTRKLNEKIPRGKVEVETVVTMISNGTELKFFRGDFGDSEPLDETIEGMSDKAASYPLEYGYSMIGKVVGCGEGVDAREWLGEIVFLFHPHASAALYDAEGLIKVPAGIEPMDAVFLPAVETVS
jgi:hypothetical protein